MIRLMRDKWFVSGFYPRKYTKKGCKRRAKRIERMFEWKKEEKADDDNDDDEDGDDKCLFVCLFAEFLLLLIFPMIDRWTSGETTIDVKFWTDGTLSFFFLPTKMPFNVFIDIIVLSCRFSLFYFTYRHTIKTRWIAITINALSLSLSCSKPWFTIYGFIDNQREIAYEGKNKKRNVNYRPIYTRQN